ncbi:MULTISPECIES: hypothetical protein [Haloferacaceae]|jgi:hypothetical protein|uniref:Uncharacterized protein n=2 Tax=Halorubrum TaxID=56688 RepID=A0ABD5UND7_9EURY|nr:hypothetical protein [Halobellus captivus]
MSNVPTRKNDGEPEAEEACEPRVPVGVLRGLRDLENGDTATKDDLESALNF